MEAAAHSPLAAWEAFYVIVGLSSAVLTGLQFVVIALITESRARSTPPQTAAFGAPTVVAASNGEVFVLEYLHTASDNRAEWLPRVRKILRTGAVVTLVETTR